MKNEKLSNILGLYLLGAIALAALGFIFLIKPTYTKATKTKVEVTAQQVKIADLKQLEKDTETLRSNYDEVKEKRDLILAQLPAKQEEERLLALLSQLSQQNGVVMSSFAPGAAPSTETSSLSIYGAAVNITGTYAQIQGFLTSLEQAARFIDVKSVSLSAGEKSIITASIVLQAYYQQSETPAATGGTNGN